MKVYLIIQTICVFLTVSILLWLRWKRDHPAPCDTCRYLAKKRRNGGQKYSCECPGAYDTFDYAPIYCARYENRTSSIRSAPLTIEELQKIESQPNSMIWDGYSYVWCTVKNGRINYTNNSWRPLESGRYYRQKPKEG